MLIMAPGYDPEMHKIVLSSPSFSTSVVCVSNFEQAQNLAIALVNDGVQLIELCGGFSPLEAEQLHTCVGGRVPIGVVRYSPEEQDRLSVLFK
jgi:hypothetical protein